MALNRPVFFKRLGSAIVFSIVMMVGLLWQQWAFLLLVSAIIALCLRDYFRLMAPIAKDTSWPKWLMPVTILASLLLLWLSGIKYNGAHAMECWPVLLFIPILLLLIGTLSKKTAWDAVIYALGGMLYITLPMLLLYQFRMQTFVLPLALVLMLWMNDTMAYLVGSFIGRTPFSAISPKKTWEGTAGGALFTMAGAAIWGYYSKMYTITDWMILALCAATAGTAGDLLESKLKRMAGVKDSGTLMPGHGGALDRFDSLLVATPFAYCYFYCCMQQLPIQHLFDF